MKWKKGNMIRGAGYLFRGLSLLRKRELWPFVWVPLLTNILIFSGVIVWGVSRFSAFVDRLLPSWLDVLAWLLWPLFAVGVSVVVFLTFIHLGNLIAAPFNALLSERVETLIKGKRELAPFDLRLLIKNILPALISELQKLSYFFIRMAPLVLLFFIPGLNLIASPIWMIVSAWMLTMEYADYPMSNHDILFSAQRKTLQAHRLTAFGFGLALFFLLLVPGLNFIAMPTAVAGATLMWVEELDEGGGGSQAPGKIENEEKKPRR